MLYSPRKFGELHNYLAGALIFTFFVFLGIPETADAVSQFSRKYKVECSTCHTVFPRLNAFGEEFMFNGFQWPGEKSDGDKVGKEELSDDLFIDQVGNWLGARLSLTAVEYESNGLTKNGEDQNSLNFGNSNWLQFFVAGSIFKDVSIFIELEFEESGSKFSWFHLFFTNLAGTYANLQVGRLSPVDFTPVSDRLRIWQKSDIMNIKSSNGKGSNSVNIRSSRPGIQYYGYAGPVVWFGGLDNGKDFSDTDRAKNYWAGARLYVPFNKEGPFGGTSIGYHFYQGIDHGGVAATPDASLENDFTRHTLSANIRYSDHYDLQFVYQFARDDNFDLTPSPTPLSFDGFTVTGAYWRDNWYAILQYDQVNSGDISLVAEVNKLSPSLWYLFRNNFKLGLVGRVDLSGSGPDDHLLGVEIRTMF
ncbi:MAG: hypothetical protein IIA63_07540 [Nitrospinae bacterium]|nr:hypothetical protein [Nitrospinota bacterium]